MGLVVYWYDFVCFAIVAAAMITAIIVIKQKEVSRVRLVKPKYESLLLARPDDERYVSVSRPGHVGKDMLWMSCWKGLHPGWLLMIRVVSGLVLSGFLAWDVKRWGTDIFVYYTEWTFALVIVYFGIGTVVSAYGCYLHETAKAAEKAKNQARLISNDMESNRYTTINNGQRGGIKLQSDQEQLDFEETAGFWGYAMQIAYQTCAGAVMLTDIVFWCLIVPFMSTAHLSLNVLMGCMHTLNLVFFLLDTSINSLPFPWFRISYFVLWSGTYIIFQWVIHAMGFPWWPYPFLELDTAWAPLWYFGMALAHIPCYGIYALVVRMKNVVFTRLFPNSFVRTY